MVEQKITEIKKSIVEYSVLVESMIDKTIKGLLKKDKTMLETVMKIDEPTANNREVEIEENCIVVIAEESPKAKDLRTILMAIKMNNDLERIADMAVNICESGIYLAAKNEIVHFSEIEKMSSLAVTMMKDSINAFIFEDADLAKDVCERDDAVDDLGDKILSQAIKQMAVDPNAIKANLHVLRVARDLERLGDISTNISEEVIFMVEGRVIKHGKDEQIK